MNISNSNLLFKASAGNHPAIFRNPAEFGQEAPIDNFAAMNGNNGTSTIKVLKKMLKKVVAAFDRDNCKIRLTQDLYKLTARWE
jgi:hypothetical protein